MKDMKKKKPSLKDYPNGYVESEGGFWTYSRRAARSGRSGWMFTKLTKEKK